VEAAKKAGATPASSVKDVASKLASPRVVWIMVPAGRPVDGVLSELASALSKGDIVIDGGNSHYRDSMRRAKELSASGVHYLDVGTSGGLSGAESGACITVGGEREVFESVEQLFADLSTKDGYGYMGSSGAGHFVKMVHNGIEYALLQAYGEGFELIEKSEFKPDLAEVARVWNNGSVIRSWLTELAERAFRKDKNLSTLSGVVGGGETGRWACEEALRLEVPAPLMTLSLLARYRSKQEDSFAGKVVAALRREFGGHEVKKK
jgi:6-phosphogluconate dehydrogenase